MPKSAKIIFSTESLASNCWFEQPERSARSRTIRLKSVSIQWWFQKHNSFTCRGPNKKVDFLGCIAWWAKMTFFILYISLNYSPRSTSSSGGHIYEKYQRAGVYPRYYRKVGLGQWWRQKMPYSEQWVFANQLIFANMWIPRQQRSAGSPTIRSKNVSELWRHRKWHWLIAGGPLKKSKIFESRSELISYDVWTFHNHVTHNRVHIAPWVTLMKMNIGQWSNDWVQKIYLSCHSERKKFSEVLFSIFHVDSESQNGDFLFRNGPNGLGP